MKENIGRTPNTITIRTTIRTVPVLLVSIMCLKDSEETTVPIRIEKEKYYVSFYLTHYLIMMYIWNRFINIYGIKRYKFPLVSIVCSKNTRRKMFAYGWRKNKYYGEIVLSSLHTSICDNDNNNNHINLISIPEEKRPKARKIRTEWRRHKKPMKLFITKLYIICMFQTSTHCLNVRANLTEKHWKKNKKNQ